MGPRRWAYHRPVQPRSTFGTIFRWVVVLALALSALAVLFTVGFKLWVDAQTGSLIYEYDDPALPENRAALVFGAGLNRAGGPSAILYDRVATAVDLYAAGKVSRLLMSGDNSTTNYNEVEAMRQTAVHLGVPDVDIYLDYAGFNSWDSCYRARDIFGLDSATLVTQEFHLPRAVFTCRHLGVEAVGVAADRQPYRTGYNELREYVAMAGTAWRMLINDKPRFLGEPVDIDVPQVKE
jgi:vancomycin permeability regulator SanA